jgi:hypothetical protein
MALPERCASQQYSLKVIPYPELMIFNAGNDPLWSNQLVG